MMSHGSAMTFVPNSACISEASSSIWSFLEGRSTRATSAPAWASAAAALRPSPPAAPVTNPFLPFMESLSVNEYPGSFHLSSG